MSKPTLQERRASLEQDIAAIRAQYKDQPTAVTGRTRPDFLDNYIGLSPDTPMFDAMVRHIEERRERERQEAIREADEAETSE
jgi:predicted aminopeptidase